MTVAIPDIYDLRTNFKWIRRILHYWFTSDNDDADAHQLSATSDDCHRNDLATLQKKLWMISQQNDSLRRDIDRYIIQHFGVLLCQLSSGPVDATTTTTTTTTNTSCSSSSSSTAASTSFHNPQSSLLWYQWCIEDSDVYGWEGKLAAIIVLDQFSRHVHRGLLQRQQELLSTTSTTDTTHGENSSSDWEYIQKFLPKQSVLDEMAYTTTQLLLQNHSREYYSTSVISIPMRIFAIMPLRHQSTNLPVIQQTQHYIDSIFTVQQESCYHMIQAFRKATNRRLAVLQDDARRTGSSAVHGDGKSDNHHIPDATHSDPDHSINHMERRTPIRQQFTNEDVLECGYFIPENPDTAPINHVVYTTIQNFLDQYILDSSSSSNADTSTEGTLNDAVNDKTLHCQLPHQKPIIISLSGGVDSMVICAVLAHLQKYNHRYKDLHIIAVHIDYANRPESHQESKFVQYYCEEILSNVTYHCRRIDEVTRGITARDVYERMARDIRYQFYRDIIRMYQTNVTNHIDEPTLPPSAMKPTLKANAAKNSTGVLLGHHRGDLRENVLSNAHKGCGPLDLSGMTSISHNDGVVLLRPLLPLEKSFIFDYAHKFGIPYFKDTTPHWSTRGKLRNKLLPLLEEIYGEGSMNNLSNLAVESDECRGLLHTVMIQPFLESIAYRPMGVFFPTSRWKSQGIFFWKIVLREALHSAGLGMFSDKSVESFMKRVCCTKVHEGWLQCRKDYGVYLRTDGYIFVLYPASFPWGNPPSVKDVVAGWTKNHTNIECSEESTIVYAGPWTVTTRRHQLAAGNINEKLEQRVFTTMESFMEGEYEYWLEIPPALGLVSSHTSDHQQAIATNRSKLSFTTFVKSTRPKAWKGIDPKIQDSLPILGYITSTENGKIVSVKPTGDVEVDDKRTSERYCAMIKLSLTISERCARQI